MKIRYAFLIVLMFAAGCSSKKNLPLKADNNAFDIFLFIGQSNMAGHAKIEPLDTATLTSVFLFNDKNQWEKAANTTSGGLNRYSNVKGKTNSLSLSYAFSRKINQYTSRKIGVVSNARGATTVTWWQKGYEGKNDYNLYEGTIERARAALASTPGAKIKGIIWNQGEGDNNEASGSQYLERLNKLVTDLRTDLGDQNIPFIAGEVGKWNNRGLFVNPEIRKIKNSISNSDWVSSDGFTSINQTKNDPHFDILSTRALGGRYADKAAELIYHVKPAGITVFNDTDFKGRSVLLVEGNYSKSDLEKQGILMSEIASMKADKEYELFLNLANAKEIMITNNSKMNLTDVQLLSVKKRKH